MKGNFVAVARKNVLSILSSQFKERLRLSLPFKSVVGDSDVNQVIKGIGPDYQNFLDATLSKILCLIFLF